jgi:1,4-alpha-glucan branching enzyme
MNPMSGLDLIARGEHPDPFGILGPHDGVIRTFQPGAKKVAVVLDGRKPAPAARAHPAGVFEARVAAASYRLRVTTEQGEREFADPYAYPPLLTDFDLHLMGEGSHYQNYEKLGAHVRSVDGVTGVHFAVWAPTARRVSVAGDFNRWDGRAHPMRVHGNGVWEIFIPGLGEGEVYKFEILAQNGDRFLKSDPYAFRAELRPASGSVVYELDRYQWQDAAWVAERERTHWLERPVAIYEVHLGSWRRKNGEWLTYPELADRLIPYVQDLGFTHIELLPVMEYPYDGSWGYQTVGYFAATSRYGTPADFMNFVDRCHQAGLGVILDWTPAHFPRDAHGLAWFDGSHLYEHADPRQGAHPDWGTLVFNYGRHEVQNFLVSNALFWMDKYHIDGLRVDAVASMLYLDYSRQPGEWVPNQYGGRENLEAMAFLKRLNEVVHARHPGVLMIAEESTSWPAVTRPTYVGGLGFLLKWNMGWMHDTLKYLSLDPIHRKFHHNQITFSLIYAFSENFVLALSHDEVVHLKGSLLHKMAGDSWRQFATLRLLYAYLYAHPGKKLLFMGSELAQRNEWNFAGELQWDLLEWESHQGVYKLLAELNRLYRAERALYEVDFDWRGFQWSDCHDADHSVLSFLRQARDSADSLLVVCNFTPVVRRNYRVGVPAPGTYDEILNTDALEYWGSNVRNGPVTAEAVRHLEWEHSLSLTLPPLGAVYLKRRAND